jgi:hypothetical protein
MSNILTASQQEYSNTVLRNGYRDNAIMEFYSQQWANYDKKSIKFPVSKPCTL